MVVAPAASQQNSVPHPPPPPPTQPPTHPHAHTPAQPLTHAAGWFLMTTDHHAGSGTALEYAGRLLPAT